MIDPSNPDPSRLRARQIRQAIRRLRAMKVRTTRIAGVLDETPDYIRQLARRAKAALPLPVRRPLLSSEDLSLVHLSEVQRVAQQRRNLQCIRIRTKQDLEQVEKNVWAIFNNHQSVGFAEAYEALTTIVPSVANARHGQALKVRLLIQEKLAWLALPLGNIEGALAHAETAMSLSRRALRESAGEKQYLLRYGEAALVASACLQKLHRPKGAMRFIQAADEANEAAGELPGSEHLRQKGASFLQMGIDRDDDAKGMFSAAPERMKQKHEAKHILDLKMMDLRQRAFLEPEREWDNVQNLVVEVAETYGSQSMQHAVAAKSAAAVGLKLATPATNHAALRLLDSISPVPSSELPKGVSHILAMTPELGLKGEALDIWLRFAMNETPLPPQ